MNKTLAIRIDADNPDHHLWRNGCLVWRIHYTVHYELEAGAGRKRRVRYSLGTTALDRARVLRDAIFAAWSDPPELLSGARIEVADHDGLTLRCAAPDPASVRRLARIDRGMNMLGTLVDDFYLATDRPREPTSLVLWIAIDPSQLDGEGCIVPVARVPLADLGGGSPSARRTAAAHLLYAWIRRAVQTSEEYEVEHQVQGSDLLDTRTARHVLESACRDIPLDLARIDERSAS